MQYSHHYKLKYLGRYILQRKTIMMASKKPVKLVILTQMLDDFKNLITYYNMYYVFDLGANNNNICARSPD